MSSIITVQKKKRNANSKKVDTGRDDRDDRNIINPMEFISNFTEADNVQIKMVKKTRLEGEYTQIIIDKFLEDMPDSKFNKLAIKTLNKKSNSAYCKIRINDDHCAYINKLYKEKYFTQFKFKILLELFKDQNSKEHTNLVIEISDNTKFYEFYQNIITMIKTVDNLGIYPDTNTNSNPVNESANPAAIPNQCPPLIEQPVSQVAENPATLESITEEPEQSPTPATHNPPNPSGPIPVFNTITLATLDTEARYIMDLECHIAFLQRNLTILKETHEINIKCYNDRIAIQNKFMKEVNNPNPSNPIADSVDSSKQSEDLKE